MKHQWELNHSETLALVPSQTALLHFLQASIVLLSHLSWSPIFSRLLLRYKDAVLQTWRRKTQVGCLLFLTLHPHRLWGDVCDPQCTRYSLDYSFDCQARFCHKDKAEWLRGRWFSQPRFCHQRE